MITAFIDALIGVPVFVGTYQDYWTNTWYMVTYSLSFILFMYIVKRLMMIFDWGVKIARFIKSKVTR